MRMKSSHIKFATTWKNEIQILTEKCRKFCWFIETYRLQMAVPFDVMVEPKPIYTVSVDEKPGVQAIDLTGSTCHPCPRTVCNYLDVIIEYAPSWHCVYCGWH